MKRISVITLLALLLAGPLFAAEREAWTDTLERISSGVVSIRVDATRAFDTDWNTSTQATGFVVDAERGLILTNRHVVTPGPVVAEAVFLNNEEVPLTPVYRDPVHDFGFFSYDPGALRFIEPAELELSPAGARTGREIRVVGNDAGEQLSILAGTIARLDRQAPEYGRGKYNDFNTFYLQAASGTSGGSSGSPVVDIDGRVVALNAGANSSAASSFFLPLDRIERALELIRAGEPVSRGTLQTVFVRRPYDELVRLGLDPETEAAARAAHPEQTGMLTVAEVLPDSPADGLLEVGDVLVRLNGEIVTEFVPLSAVLDDSVGGTVRLELRRGGSVIEHDVRVQDLHAITPDEYIEFGDAVLHRLSYQQARHYNRPVDGVYVANPGYVLSNSAIPRAAVLTELDSQPVSDLDDLESVLDGLADGERTSIRFVSLEDPRTSQLRSLRIDRRWFPSKRCRRDDDTGLWPCRELAAGPPPEMPAVASTRFPPYDDRRAEALAPSLVLVNFDLPYTISGVAERHYYGTGLVVDAERGLVVVDRNTVPVAMGDVHITFAGSLEVPGRVEYVHPLHNLTIVSYDPALIGDTPVRSARFNTSPAESGDAVWVVGLKPDHRLVHQQTRVASVDALVLPLSRTLRFRDTNLEALTVVNAPDQVDGVLADERGRVVSLWSSFAYQGGGETSQVNKGVPADLVEEFVDLVRSGGTLYSLEAELAYLPLAAARKLGLPEEWAARLERHHPEQRRALQVKRLVAGSPAARLLNNGDILLSIDDEVVNTFRDVERAMQKPSVKLAVWRRGSVREMEVATVALDGTGIDRAMMWAGALLQKPHRAMAAQRGIDPSGVYVAYFSYGSPATRYGLWAGRRIVEVDGRPTPDLDAFLEAVRGKEHRESVRLKTVNWNLAVEVITLKLDKQYWPAYEIRRTGDGWERRPLG
ncbi:trypsin-like peptidase domain-containing protein [Lentisalinibacter orientalis]|uniref:trypsin-like peptidase domain-containing protein n=1 Tax=Lentisalinibacter orientalis TaxID=2992241 RepID=UPI00386DC487